MSTKIRKNAGKLKYLHQILGLFMKKTTFITAIVAIMMMAVTPVFAQEENGFKKFNVREDFTENGFQWFHDAELLAAGDKEKSNAMTIGWGGIGTPYYTEATMVIECKILYAAPFDPQYFKSEVPKNMYANFPAGIHSMYIGEVVNAWKK